MTTTQQLRATAHGVLVSLSKPAADALMHELGDVGATDHVLSLGALLTLADVAYGKELSQADADELLRRADHDFDAAAERLRARFDPAGYWQDVRALEAARRRLESRYYGNEARRRHAAFLSDIGRLSLGHQAVQLLAAADDAKLVDPSADYYRQRILKSIDRETDRRYPRRETITVAPEGSAHLERVDAADAEERAARDMVLKRLPALSLRIDRLSSRALCREVEQVLCEVRGRLAKRIVQGWTPNREKYAAEVSAKVMTEARNAL